MKKVFWVLTIFLTSCAAPSTLSGDDDAFASYETYFVPLAQSLNQEMDTYYLYFYSPLCHLCMSLKDKVIHYAETEKNLFVISPNEKVSSNDNPYHSMGKTDYKSLAIAGYPTLMLVAYRKISVVYYGLNEVSQALEIK